MKNNKTNYKPISGENGITMNLDLKNDELYNSYQAWLHNNHSLLNLNNELARVNAKSATIVAELEEKNNKLSDLNSKLAKSNALSAELMAEIEEKNELLSKTNKSLSKANAHAAELMSVIELKDEKIQKLNNSLVEVNARSANLVAKRELQMIKIQELNRELQYEIETREKTEFSLKKSNEAKDRFFSIIAHDLRNPFISIVGLVSILKEYGESFTKEEIIELIGDLFASAQSTQTLLENLLEWSKTQTNRIEVEPNTCLIKRILEETFQICRYHAESKNISIELNYDNQLKVFADKNMISTVVRNLLSNAIKFSNHNSKIILSAEEKNNKVKISIKDQGIGISPNKLEKLFRLDSRITSKGTANEKGSGLGLILCKEFIEKNGGEINVESKYGEGSTFSFTIPSHSKNN